jgi:FtsP/CotA-like multicopper oxidase with cupredoxin domain
MQCHRVLIRSRGVSFGLALNFALAGCAAVSAVPTPPAVPDALHPPAGQTAFLELHGAGVQIYQCAATAADAATFEWTFRAPEATLSDRSGRVVGRHFAGPTWESTDGSRVVGELKARAPAPRAHAIAWLLLEARSTGGMGLLSPTRSIQRTTTSGGAAPAQPCGAAQARAEARVPYTATYYFYR